MSSSSSGDASVNKDKNRSLYFLGIPIAIWIPLIGIMPAVLTGYVGLRVGVDQGRTRVEPPQFVTSDPKEERLNKVKGEFTEPSAKSIGRTIHCSGTIMNWDPTLHLWLAVEVDGYIWFKDSELDVDSKHKTWSKTIEEKGNSPTISLILYAATDQAHHEIMEWIKRGKMNENRFERITLVRDTVRLDHVDNLHIVDKP